jgi:hypothetical protein
MATRPRRGRAVERYMDPTLINVDEILEHDDPRIRLEAACGLARLVELLETARQDPDYVGCVGDADLFKHLTWAAAQITSGEVPGGDG